MIDNLDFNVSDRRTNDEHVNFAVDTILIKPVVLVEPAGVSACEYAKVPRDHLVDHLRELRVHRRRDGQPAVGSGLQAPFVLGGGTGLGLLRCSR